MHFFYELKINSYKKVVKVFFAALMTGMCVFTFFTMPSSGDGIFALRPPSIGSSASDDDGSEVHYVIQGRSFDADPVLFARLDPTLQDFVVELLVPGYAKKAFQDPQRYSKDLRYLFQAVAQYCREFPGEISDEARQAFNTVIMADRNRAPYYTVELIRWINVYLLLPNGVVIASDVHTGQCLCLLPVNGYELYRSPYSPIPIPVIYTTAKMEFVDGWAPKGAAIVKIGDSNDDIQSTYYEELAHAVEAVIYGQWAVGDFAEMCAMSGLLPQASLRTYLFSASQGKTNDAQSIRAEFRAALCLLAGPFPQKKYGELMQIINAADGDIDGEVIGRYAMGLREIEDVDNGLRCRLLSTTILASLIQAHLQGPVSLDAVRALIPQLWAEQWDSVSDPLGVEVDRIYPRSDAETAVQLDTLVAQKRRGENIPIVGVPRSVEFPPAIIEKVLSSENRALRVRCITSYGDNA
jgi:hypothetical protein